MSGAASQNRIAIKPRERDVIISALRAGVVPRSGIHHIQVGRSEEVKQAIKDVSAIAQGGAAFRVIIGDYGCGKTFFLTLTRAIAHQQKLVTVSADLSPDRRLHSSQGHARALYAELMRNMSTRASPDGGALGGIVERFLADAMDEAKSSETAFDVFISRKLKPLQDLVSGFDFVNAIKKYAQAVETGNEDLRAAALRWLRGEYELKSEAYRDLGVRTTVNDAVFYDYLKLMAGFVKLAGYAGLLVFLDECVNLYKLQQPQARTQNYEQILLILNDTMQGPAEGVGFYLGGTPEFLQDSRRGLFSYEALRSRLAENAFAGKGVIDLTGPTIRLQALTREELHVLLGKVWSIFHSGDPEPPPAEDMMIRAFIENSEKKLGASSFRTPRNTVKAFIDLMAIMEQNPTIPWTQLLPKATPAKDDGGSADLAGDADEFDGFTL